jgi:hypothetical protein
LKQWIAWAWADSGPGSKNIDRFREQVATVQRIVSCKAFAGQNDSAGMTGNPPQTILKNTPQSSHPAKEFSTPPVEPGTDGKIEDHTVWTGEIAVMLDLASRIPDGIGKIHGMILLSKPEEKRKYIKNMLEERFRCQGYDPELIVLNAYKPGLSWLLEGILPELKCRPDIARLDIFYKPFIGMDGALELRSRWLQELFPAAELIAGQLGLETDHVCFTENPDQPDIYRIQAISSLKEVLIDQGFSPRWSRMMYLDGCPDHGYVHPTTGGIRLWHDDKVILDQPIPTDREMFWQIFQKNWLPTLMESMQNRHIKSSREHALAFWENIRFSVWIEETDEALGIGEERICPMEALHEDIYFVLLAAFAHFSQTCSLPDFLQLGRIMPKTYSCLRGKNPSARLVAQPMVWPADVGCEAEAGSFETRIKGLLLTDTSIRVDISILSEKMNDDKMDELIAELYSRTYRADRFPGHIGLWLKSPVHQPASDFRRSLGRVLRWVDIPPANRLLPYSEVHDWLKRFTMVSHLSVWRAANSYRKKPVWAVEAVLASRGKCVSIPKLRLLKPTIFCNARHHANEISSTPACLITAWTLATTLPGQEWLRHVNMVFVPIENPDGVATLEEMLPQGSGRKLHAARYNALGSEYYSDYFRNPPRFPEAAAKSKLWKRWLPEIMIDHHGVPSHEWDQPFSGYAPHGFQEYWIPRTFVYAHIPFSDRTDHPLSETARGLATIMKDVLTSESDIVALNQEIAARYQRYARAPQPDVFPPTSPEPLLVYPLSERSRQTNFAIRYPNITRSDIVVEVPDEIASGEMLERCVRAHRKIQEAAILFLRRPKGYVYKESDFEAGTLRLVWK